MTVAARKPESADAHHKWITTYNHRLVCFILVPLTGDGKTRNTYGILTEDEINTSRQESEDGEEHPISHIHNHPDFWTDQRIEKEGWRFKNVATLLGKTHLSGPTAGHYILMPLT